MAKLAMIFGAMLIVLGAAYFFVTGAAHPTSLIPLAFGIVLVGCGVLANTENAKKRMIWMHVAATVGVVGFVFPAVMGVRALTHWSTLAPMHRVAAQEQLIMAAICLVFTALCVRSFIAARVSRAA